MREGSIKVSIGPFAEAMIDRHLGRDPSEVAEAALVRYAVRLVHGRPPEGIPRFRPAWRGVRRGGTVVEPCVDGRTAALLAGEARRRRVTLDRIAAHAVLVYLAEIDALVEAATTDRPWGGNFG